MFRVDRDVLAEAVAWTARSLPARPSVPVLAGMRLEVTEQQELKLSGYDY
jgi:DNA polymerase-3 subunit beta